MRYRIRVLLLLAPLLPLLCSCATTGGTKRSTYCDFPEPSLAMVKYGDDKGRYSPDGKYLCYTVRNFAYVVREDGTERRRISGHNGSLKGVPRWSPDGKRIALCSGVEGSELYTIGFDGQGLQKLGEYRDPAWSPDGKRIVAVWLHMKGPPYYELLESGISILQSSDGTILGSVEVDGHDFGPASWSPDGKSMAFGVDGHLFITDGEGQNAKRITTLDPMGGNPTLLWAPDGKRLAFPAHRGTFVYDVEKKQTKRVIGSSGLNMAWSPDGECLLVVDYVRVGGLRALRDIGRNIITFGDASEHVSVVYLVNVRSRKTRKFRYSDRVKEALARWPRVGY